MRTNYIIIEPYNSGWESEFEKIKKELELILNSLILSIEHVGSTAVQGLEAKPVIDIDAVIKDNSFLKPVIDKLQAAGYIYEGDLGIKDRFAFKYENKPHLMLHHLYVCPQNSKELKRHTAFRDYLKVNPAAAAEYGRIKQTAAELYPYDIDKYIEYKSKFIEKIYAEIDF